jgi:hypothetical protein
MKIVHGGTNVIASHGIRSEDQFKIAANAQAFRILSSGLYSDKISAVLREIGCNAADAHTAQGTPNRPIEVKLPSKLDTSFHIKDWGPGLSHEEITGLFTTYFSSNKSDNNDMTGAFGLGSKSPFSYTDSFAITTVKDSVQRSYTAHVGVTGAPVISLLDESPAADHWIHGTMVSFPVQPKDCAEFEKKAREIYRWFDVKPNLLGCATVKDPEFYLDAVGVKVGLIGDTSGQQRFSSDKVARVLMGNVAYPIRADRLEKVAPLISALLSAGAHITLPIGTVMPTAGREDLEYDESSRRVVTQALEAMARVIGERLIELAAEPASCEWLRHRHLRAFAARVPNQVVTHLPDILAKTMASSVAQAEALRLFKLDSVLLPAWIGSMVDAKTNLNLAALKPPENEVHWTLPSVETFFNLNQRFAVGLYELSDRSKTAVRRAVTSGKVTQGSRQKEVGINYLKNVTILIVDGRYGHEKAKALITCDKDLVLLIEPLTPEAKVRASDYAKATSDVLGTLPILYTQALPEPAEIVARKAAPKGPKSLFRPEVVHANKEVRYFDTAKMRGRGDFGSYECKPTKLADIPANGRYYLIASGKDLRALRIDTSKGARTLTYGEFQKGFGAYQNLQQQGVPLTDIGGLIILAPGQVRDLKLREGRWQSAATAMFDAFKAPGVGALIASRVNTMPHIVTLSPNSNHIRFSGLVGMLLLAALKDFKLWTILYPQLSEFPEFTLILEQLIAAHTQENPKSGLRVTLDVFQEAFPGTDLGFEDKRLSYEDLSKRIAQLHPMVQYVEVEALSRQIDRDPKGIARFVLHILSARS